MLDSSAFSPGQILSQHPCPVHKLKSRPDIRCEYVNSATKNLCSAAYAETTINEGAFGQEVRYCFQCLCVWAHVCMKWAELGHGLASAAWCTGLAQVTVKDGEGDKIILSPGTGCLQRASRANRGHQQLDHFQMQARCRQADADLPQSARAEVGWISHCRASGVTIFV